MESIYDDKPTGPYYYWRGFNWRAFAAYVLGVAPNFYPFLGDVGLSVPAAITHMGYFSFLMGMFVSFFFYLAFTILVPPENSLPRPAEWMEPKDYVDPGDPWLLESSSDVEGRSVQHEVIRVSEVALDGLPSKSVVDVSK